MSNSGIDTCQSYWRRSKFNRKTKWKCKFPLWDFGKCTNFASTKQHKRHLNRI